MYNNKTVQTIDKKCIENIYRNHTLLKTKDIEA